VNTKTRLSRGTRRPNSTWGRIAPALLAAACLFLAPFTVATAIAAGEPAAATVAAPPPLEIDNAKCVKCHDDPETVNEDGKSMRIVAEHYAASAHKKLECAECHTDALAIKHPRNNLGPVDMQVCTDCHEDEMNALAGSIHGQKKGAIAKTCIGCHGNLHEVLRKKDPNNSMNAVNQIQSCGECHEKMMQGYSDSVHAKALLKSGLNSAPSCTSCHGAAHEIKAHANPESATAFAHSPETCGKCHEGVLREWNESAHGAIWKDGKTDGPVCTTCHEAHAIKEPTTVAMRTQFPDECGTCHEETTKTFRDSFHGKATELGYEAVAMCSDCHTPHHNLPKDDPKSSINPANLAATCGRCHEGEVNAAFLTFDPHANPADASRNPWVHYIYLFMTALLLGVFGFFGIHALLWLQRSLVGKLRGEFPVHSHEGPWVKRFSGFQIGLHVSIVLSFLLLAATGLPLKFAGAPWAPGLMDFLGGPQVAGWLHRLAAIVTFGYFAFHIGGLLHAKFVRGDKGNYLWGWRSMTPQLKDVQDLYANLKYFLYLGPRPKLDRWAYWEKFDYLAVFWGVAMIGVSGLALWFPGFFTKFLPGWALNAAYVIHSDEALLATGFIFLFHFFHTHLRPESFPLDPVVFTGSQPLARLKDERPLEYERLVKSGELEKLFVPPPSRAVLVRAYVFGFAAVAIGIALAVAIFVALLGGAGH
jgi:cytochrome b subunit of formate dehydrogenase